MPPYLMKPSYLHAVILVGGSGTRFWPASREDRPKQFLTLIGRTSLLQQTLSRILSSVPAGNIWIIANHRHKEEMRCQKRGFNLRTSQILWESQAKNTAPAIAWAAARIHALNPQAVMVVLPCDHLILNRVKFLQLLENAIQLAQRNYLVTFGVVPTRPETGYGYLKTKREKGILHVQKFIEKPGLAKAKRFIAENRKNSKNCSYMWNSGMFVWKTQVIWEAFQRYLPMIYAHRHQLPKAWSGLPAVSIDYGILEKARNVVAVTAGNLGWSDLGSWESLSEVLPQDNKGNTVRGNVISLDCHGTLALGNRRLVATIGLEDMVIIDTPDALLVCPKSRSQEVKKLVEAIQGRVAQRTQKH